MKRAITLICFIAVACLVKAQQSISINKPINKKEWVELEKNYFNQAYGTVSIINDNGIVEKLIGDKPSNPQDKVTWRPPPIPPKDNPDNPQGVKKNPLKIERGRGIKPKPIDPGCPTCSIFIFSDNVNVDIIKQAQKALSNYQ